MIKTNSLHLVADLHQYDKKLIRDVEFLAESMRHSAAIAGANVINEFVQQFKPSGASLLFSLSESHISMHTWPEYEYVAVDFFMCGECDPETGLANLVNALQAQKSDIVKLSRGNIRNSPSLFKVP